MSVYAPTTSPSLRSAPKISVVTVNLNDRIGLERTLTSVRAQSYEKYEHVVIDGASTDGSLDVWMTQCSSDPRCSILSEPDNGIYEAMNKGIGRITGDIVQFLNAGDTLVDSFVFERVARAWMEDRSWNWGYGGLRILTPSGQLMEQASVNSFRYSSFRWGSSYVPHPSSFVSAELFKKFGGFSQMFGIAGDQEFFMRISKRYAPYQWDSCFANFYLGGAHSTVNLWQRERLWHQMRRANGAMACDSVLIDRAVMGGLAIARFTVAVLRFAMKFFARKSQLNKPNM